MQWDGGGLPFRAAMMEGREGIGSAHGLRFFPQYCCCCSCVGVVRPAGVRAARRAPLLAGDEEEEEVRLSQREKEEYHAAMQARRNVQLARSSGGPRI